MVCFSKDAESLTMCGCVLSCSPIVYIRAYSLKTTAAFYFVTEWLSAQTLQQWCVRVIFVQSESQSPWVRVI